MSALTACTRKTGWDSVGGLCGKEVFTVPAIFDFVIHGDILKSFSIVTKVHCKKKQL